MLMNTPTGLLPVGDDSYDEKKRLKLGQTYIAEIRVPRNIKFHKKYFSLINLAWEYLPEKTSKGFRTKENFRKYVEVAAGWCDPFFSPGLKQWVEIPKSISFASMDDTQFTELYDRVKGVIFTLIGKYVTEEEFDRYLSQF